MEAAAGGPSALGEDLVHRLHVCSAEVLLHARVLLIRPDDSSARVTGLSDDGASGPLESLQQVLPDNNKLNDRILLRSDCFRRFRRLRRCFGGRHGDDRACCRDSGSEARGRQSRCCRQKRSSDDEEEARPHAARALLARRDLGAALPADVDGDLHTRVQAKIHSLANSAAARATCRPGQGAKTRT